MPEWMWYVIGAGGALVGMYFLLVIVLFLRIALWKDNK